MPQNKQFQIARKSDRSPIKTSRFARSAIAQPKKSPESSPLPEWQPNADNWQVNTQNPLAAMYGNLAFAPVQAKLTIGEVGDKYEQEADRIASQVVQRLHTSPRQGEGEEQPLQMKVGDRGLQCKAAGGNEVSQEFERDLGQAKSGGQSLDSQTQTQMGQAMGADFSGVKIHTDATASRLSDSIQAKAFTTGQDIFFKQGQYNPGSRGGQSLIAHELTHVMQQGGSSIQAKFSDGYIQRGGGSSGVSSESSVDEPTPTTEEIDAPLDEMPSLLQKDKTIEKGQGVIAAVCKEELTGGHSWVGLEYLSAEGAAKHYVLHLTAAGGKGDSASGGSSGTSSGIAPTGSTVGSSQSAVVSDKDDSGSLTYSGSTNSNVGSAPPERFKGSITVTVNPSKSHLSSIATKVQRNWDITEGKALKALAKADKIKAKADSRKLIYAFTGHSISFTREGMNCAKFAEQVLNAAGIPASAGWWVKTPSELSTGKKGGIWKKKKKSDDSGSSSSS
ncbi:DUF4157 domain-containing protein [Spirulina sp. 06S082]|uniref:eCIS core domain-containing protein n=1 Tax=Spirulina sp. 06S082 TaxID=3110248 RepID=UPI002B1EE51A|nr:DUF4157 domain-containing protein [Spirulina sp. 06S082]MEA5470577.1 DUF4157 domain-containing protein [Spirulina sp. 06S082]